MPWFSVNCFGVRVSPYVFSYYFSSDWVAECPPFWKGLLTRLIICSLCILNICFGFEGWTWGLIASVPVFAYFLFLTVSYDAKNCAFGSNVQSLNYSVTKWTRLPVRHLRFPFSLNGRLV